MLKRPVPELALALGNKFDEGAAVVVVALLVAGLLDPKRPPEDDCGKPPNKFEGTAAVGVSCADISAAFWVPKALAGCC